MDSLGPEVPKQLKPAERKYEHGLHLWEEPRDPKTDFIERTFRSWPQESQEKHFSEALLMAVRGTPSVLVAPVVNQSEGLLRGRKYPGIQFMISELVDDTMGKFAEPVLDLAADHALIWRFGKEHLMSYHNGLVNQALGASLVGICLELHEFICVVWDEVQTAPAPLSMVRNKLSLYAPVFKLLRDLLDRHEGKCGAAVLNLLEQTRAQHVGTPVGELTLNVLLDQASRPFFEILSAWVYEGKNIASWEFPLTRPEGPGAANFMQWQLAPSSLPRFLQESADRILQSGKLALILKQANRLYDPVRVPMRYAPDASVHTAALKNAFTQANTEVLNLLRVDHKLIDRISFLHHFILCGSADWVADFMDHCAQHPHCALDRKVREARWDELQHAMKNCCDSSAASGKYPKAWLESLRLEAASKSMIKIMRKMSRMQDHGYTSLSTSTSEDSMRLDMEVIQALQLTVPLEWPVSLVVHETAMLKYQLLGRLILRVKGLLHHLHRFSRRAGARLSGKEAAAFRATCALRAAMIQFLSNFETYLLFEVIEPRFSAMKQRLAQAKTVEEIIVAHDTFIDECIVSAMATSEGLYKRMEMVFLTIRLFASSLQAMEKLGTHQLNNFPDMFRERLGELLKEMHASASGKGDTEVKSLQHMLGKLDFNKYYLKEKLYGDFSTTA
ncbi:Gamma-tubulin complex component 2 [Diplonema papillatum]|nr:Gamma-tubulin complex component 2 [Diplonema papillatum]